MQFTLPEIIGTAIGILVIGIILGRFFLKREGEGLFSRIFKDNRDFDSTLDRLCITTIIMFLLISFHDEMKNPATAGLIINLFVLAFNAWQSLVLGKAVRDMQKAEHNGAQGGKPQ